MTCDRARRLFGACWDDELTQAEREWFEAHLASCDRCRAEYDEFSRAVEWVGALPRTEASPGLEERVLARTRRAVIAPDRLPRSEPRWVAAAAVSAAVVLVVGALLLVPRASWWAPGTEPPRVAYEALRSPTPLPTLKPQAGVEGSAEVMTPERAQVDPESEVAVVPDSLFDHGEDVEFILDPVTLHRGRALVTRAGSRVRGVEGEQAIISF
jgi:anti-sigma factor RsiW